MPLPPKNNHRITIAEASVLTAKYRQHAGIGATKGGMFWKEPVEVLLSQERCVALRFYYAENGDGKPTLVLVGVDKEGKDILDGVMLDLVWPCPPFCDQANVLNSNTNLRTATAERSKMPLVSSDQN